MSILEAIKLWQYKTGKAFGSIMTSIARNQEWINELKELTAFLDEIYVPSENISIQQRFYHVWFDYYNIEVCTYCDSPRSFSNMRKFSIDRYGEKPTNQVNYYATCMSVDCNKKYNLDKTQEAVYKKYGVLNYLQTTECKEKVKATNLERYGVEYQTQSQNFKEKTKTTWIKKYGVDHHTQSESSKQKKIETNRIKYGTDYCIQNQTILDKIQNTNMERYGGVSSMCSDVTKAKSIATNIEKYGSNWYMQSADFRKKSRDTMMEKYGVEHIMQYTPSFEKNMYKKKAYMFPSGRIEKIQGYEGFAINDLLNSGYIESDLIISNIDIEKRTGKIWYHNNEDNKIHKYYPDIYIVSENKIIEVKSEYTFNTHKKMNIQKQQASKLLGIEFEFWIYNAEGEKIIK